MRVPGRVDFEFEHAGFRIQTGELGRGGAERQTAAIADCPARTQLTGAHALPGDDAVGRRNYALAKFVHAAIGLRRRDICPDLNAFDAQNLDGLLEPEIVVPAKGRQQRRYRWYATPWEILRQLPDSAGDFKADVTIAELDRKARAVSDLQAALEMQDAKHKLFARFQQRRTA